MEIAQTILQQLGGNKIQVMIGMHQVLGGENFLQFAFKACKKANKCKIILNHLDLYDIEFYKLKPTTLKNLQKGVDLCPMVESFSDIHVEDLVRTFEEFTGLATRL